MKLATAVESYLTLKRSLGAVFSAEARILRSFARALGDIPLDEIDQETTYAFCRGTGPLHPVQGDDSALEKIPGDDFRAQRSCVAWRYAGEKAKGVDRPLSER